MKNKATKKREKKTIRKRKTMVKEEDKEQTNSGKEKLGGKYDELS